MFSCVSFAIYLATCDAFTCIQQTEKYEQNNTKQENTTQRQFSYLWPKPQDSNLQLWVWF